MHDFNSMFTTFSASQWEQGIASPHAGDGGYSTAHVP